MGFSWIDKASTTEWVSKPDLSDITSSVHMAYVKGVHQMSPFPEYFSDRGASVVSFFYAAWPFLSPNSICQALPPPWCVMESNGVLQKQKLIEITSTNLWLEFKEFKPQCGLLLNMRIYSLSFGAQLLSACLLISKMAVVTECTCLGSLWGLNGWAGVQSSH